MFVLFSNTTFSLIKNKETVIRYCKTSFLVFIFLNSKTEKLCYYFINYCHCCRPVVVVVVDIPASSSKSSSSVSCCQCCSVVVGSGVPSCGCFRRLLHLVGGGVLSLLSSAASPLLKLTYPFVHHFQQVIGTNRKVSEKV